MKETVIVAMSGGVDSSVSAYKLLEIGYNVIGTTLIMGRSGDYQAVEDAKKVAEKLKIKHITLDVKNDFSTKVLEYFKNSYVNGKTPNPCAMCNKFIKFKYIINLMQELKADYIATGHYAKIVNDNNIYKMFKAKDLKKDQSYFLSYIDKEYLKYIKFPLEDILDKMDTRKIADSIGLHNAFKNDSQDICFINKNYKDFLKQNNIIPKNGLIKHINGEILAEHNGIINYTIGQRKGLNISYKSPIYVVKLDTENNIVYVSENENDLYNKSFKIKNLNLLDNIENSTEYTFKLRSTHIGQNGFIDKENLIINLKENSRAITSGQLCCIYKNDQVIGSGWIE